MSMLTTTPADGHWPEKCGRPLLPVRE